MSDAVGLLVWLSGMLCSLSESLVTVVFEAYPQGRKQLHKIFRYGEGPTGIFDYASLGG